MKKIGITGANSFIGSFLVKKFTDQGYSVKCFIHNNCDQFNPDNYEIIKGDLRIEELQKKFCKDLDTVIHCASIPSTTDDYIAFKEFNYECTKKLFEQSKQSGVKQFINLSTIRSYSDEGIITEKSKLDINCSYSVFNRYKAKLDRHLLDNCDGINLVIIHSGAVINPDLNGPGQMGRTLKRMFNGGGKWPQGGFYWINILDLVNIIEKVINGSTNIYDKQYIAVGEWASFDDLARKSANIANVVPPKGNINLFLLKIILIITNSFLLLIGRKKIASLDTLDAMNRHRNVDGSYTRKVFNIEYTTLSQTLSQAYLSINKSK